jgi:hypothetical protein
VQTVNIARPRQPLWIRRDAWPGALRITLAESLAAIPAGWNGVFLVNVKRPEEPYLYRWLAIPGAYAQDVAFTGNIMSVAAGPAGLLYYDISNPYLPILTDTLRQPGYTNHVAVRVTPPGPQPAAACMPLISPLTPRPSPLAPRNWASARYARRPAPLRCCPTRR